MVTNKSPKSPKIILCNICDYKCFKKSEFNKHITTGKHIANALGDKKISEKDFVCVFCNKQYNSRNGLWKHNKICMDNKNIIQNENSIIETQNEDNSLFDSSNNEIKILTDLVLELVKNNTELQKQNQEFQKQVLDVCKNIQPGMVNSNNINTVNHNKTFNLQVFLNEECKDAMNLKDFVNSFKLQLSDLELVGDEGFINGMTKVILAKLDLMDVNTRPFHCTDLKRETIYIKEDDVWVREGPENSKLAAAIKAIGHQNFFILKEYKALHPDCESTYSEFNDHYMNLIMKSAGCQKEDIAKVIKKLVKEIVIIK
jgi:hypothetical protein